MNDQTTAPTRDQLRAALVGTVHKPVRKLVSLFGQQIELQQPTLKSVLEARETGDEMTRTADIFVRYAYVPGTDVRIFEEADREQILAWPFNEDLIRVQETIAELTGVNIGKAEEVIESDPLGGSS